MLEELKRKLINFILFYHHHSFIVLKNKTNKSRYLAYFRDEIKEMHYSYVKHISSEIN